MARKSQYGLVGLFIVLLVVLIGLPILKATFPMYYSEGFRAASPCFGVICKNEGERCQDGKCVLISPPYTNDYFRGE
jgi:hypothetical protein